jgi:DNA-binding IclR family transcriptional regulator
MAHTAMGRQLSASPSTWPLKLSMRRTRRVKKQAEDSRRYRAPALEKGLDILELLASEGGPMTISSIVQRLGRSTGELFRMVQVLEYRRFIEQAEASEGYRLTGRLFALGMDHPHVKTLLEVALPVIRQVSRTTGQSCHLAVHSNGQIVVIARIESSEQIGFTVRLGYRRALQRTVSGVILYAFQNQAIRTQWERLLKPPLSKSELVAFRKRADEVRLRGFERAASTFVAGITDISAPIMNGELAVAALTVPFVHSNPVVMSENEAALCVKAAATQISADLLHAD